MVTPIFNSIASDFSHESDNGRLCYFLCFSVLQIKRRSKFGSLTLITVEILTSYRLQAHNAK